MDGENARPPSYATMPPDRPAPNCVLFLAVEALVVTVATGDTYATLPPAPVEKAVAPPPLVLAFSPYVNALSTPSVPVSDCSTVVEPLELCCRFVDEYGE